MNSKPCYLNEDDLYTAMDIFIVVPYVRALERESIALAAVVDTPEPLLGISTMEDLGIALDPTTGEATKVRAAGLMLRFNHS